MRILARMAPVAGWMALILALSWPVVVAAQEDVTITKEQLEELKRKAAEADRLQRQLQDAQREIQTLKGGAPIVTNVNVVVTNVVTAPVIRDSDKRVVPIPQAVFQNIATQPPTPPLPEVPPVTPDTVISVNDLVTYFAQNPEAAKERFYRKTFAIRGVVTDFRKPLFLGTYDVNFRLPNQPLHVNCLFRPPPEFTRFYVSESGEEMVGHTYNARTVFARVGAELTIRGYCEGVKDGYVRLGGCQYLVNSKPSSNASR